MKKNFQIIFFLFVVSQNLRAQFLYTGYASCGASNGYLNVDPGGGLGYTFLWSTGNTTCCVSVPPGNYWVTVTDTINGNSYTLNATMWADTWQLHISQGAPGSLFLHADLLGCQSLIYTAPSCNPFPYNGARGIIWEDSIPIDTIYNISCDNWSHTWYGVQPGHCYDFSIFEPSCNCFQATWMFNPSRQYCEPFTQVNELREYYSIKLIPSIIHSDAKFQADDLNGNENLDFRIYNSLGSLIRTEKISNLNSYILHREDLNNGLYYFQLSTLSSQLIGSGKFIVE